MTRRVSPPKGRVPTQLANGDEFFDVRPVSVCGTVSLNGPQRVTTQNANDRKFKRRSHGSVIARFARVV
jgi:hypothetical protein